MGDNESVSALSAMVEFNSSRAEAHASFFIGSLFGIFTILAMVYSKENISVIERQVWSFINFILILVGLYFFYNFSHYAIAADKFRQKIVDNPDNKIKYGEVINNVNKRKSLKILYNLEKCIHEYKLKIFPLMYLFILILSWLMVFYPEIIMAILSDC